MSNHREPWHSAPTVPGESDIYSDYRTGAADLIARDIDTEYADRIVECVNACREMKRPRDEVRTLRDIAVIVGLILKECGSIDKRASSVAVSAVMIRALVELQEDLERGRA